MEDWKHVTTAREVVRGEDSPIEGHNTKAEEIRGKMKDQM